MEKLGDRRANIRLQRVLAVEIKCHGEYIPTVAVDISVTGFQVASPIAPPKGDEIHIRIYLRNGPSLHAKAELVWCQELDLGLHRLGFQFTEMSSTDGFERLCRYVEKERLNADGMPEDCEPTLELATQVTLRSLGDDEIVRSMVLAQISEFLSGCYSCDEVLVRALRVAVEATGAERGMVLVEEGDGFKVSCFHTLSKESQRDYSHSVIEAVKEEGKALISLDAQIDERFTLSSSLKVLGTRSVMCLPIQSKARRFGYLYLDCSVRSGAFTETELRLAEVIAQMAASAIERAEKFSRRAEQEKLTDIGAVTGGVLRDLERPVAELKELCEQLESGAGNGEVISRLKEEVSRFHSLVQGFLRQSSGSELAALCAEKGLEVKKD